MCPAPPKATPPMDVVGEAIQGPGRPRSPSSLSMFVLRDDFPKSQEHKGL